MLPDGPSRFPTRQIHAIDVVFPPEEQALFELVDRYTKLRMSSASTDAERAASRFVTLLLKKRLLSSPAAFKHTLDQHISTLNRPLRAKVTTRALEAAEAAIEDEADDTEQVSEQEAEALALAAGALPELAPEAEEALLAEMRARISHVEAAKSILDQLAARADERWRRPDAKTAALLDWIAATCFPGGEWNDERVIVFTEYRATLNYLDEMLTAPHPGRPSMDGRVEVFHGGLDADERERIIREFNYNPRKTKVRILLATDAASEGIDLHLACHRLVHVEVPFNPNRMEQRNGRIDRHGQKSPTVDIFHFASVGKAGAGLGYDYEFLLRVARKVDDIRDDLGSAAPVLAERIEARMLGVGDDSLDIDHILKTRRDQARVDLEKLKQQFAADIARAGECATSRRSGVADRGTTATRKRHARPGRWRRSGPSDR
jgi:superfamily II DNA or RNA helicase